MRTICGTIIAAVCALWTAFPAALESLPVPNENKAYGELYGRIVERIHLWPGLAPLCLMSEENMARSMKPVGLTDEECRDLLVWGWPLRILSSTITMNSFRIYT